MEVEVGFNIRELVGAHVKIKTVEKIPSNLTPCKPKLIERRTKSLLFMSIMREKRISR